MDLHLSDLANVLEKEIGVAEALSSNLQAQRAAIVAWNPTVLLQELERREACLRALAVLEEKRGAILRSMEIRPGPATLRRLLDELPLSSPERCLMRGLRDRASAIFTRVQAEERDLNGLMKALLSHIEEALSPLARDAAPVYTETGTSGPKRPASALVESKA
jgi:hypothetical protein